jgi:hypothetical protein
MFNFSVKQMGFSSDINDPKDLTPINIPIGELWSLSVPKTALGCDKLKVVTIKNTSSIIDESCQCEIEINTVMSKSCLYHIPNDNKTYLNIAINDKNNIPRFDVVVDELEIFEFAGGTYDELLSLIEYMDLGIDELGYGIRLYFDRKYNGMTATITRTDQVYLLSDKFCLNFSKYVGLTFGMCEIGCYRLAFVKTDGTVVAMSNQFNVIKKAENGTQVVEYYKDNIYHRHRIKMALSSPKFPTEEEQKILSNGDISISNVIIRTQRDFSTGALTQKQHLELISVFKNEFKVNGSKALLVGSYSNEQEDMRGNTIGSGTLNFKDESIINLDSCTNACTTGSSFRFEVYETERTGSIMG